jgi:alkylation response protein AidB-like acyl-CoA dehydrogenase
MLYADLDEELRDLAEMVRDLAQEKIAPLVAEVERSGTFSPKIRDLLAGAGLFGLTVPSEYDGVTSDVRHQSIVLEELAKVYPSACTYLTAHWLATKLVVVNATASDQPPWVRPLLADAASGTRLGAVALTEPDAGSDLASASTRARREGGEWVIDGCKRFITNGGVADYYTVLVRTGESGSKGLSLLHVEADREGVVASRLEEKMGLHGSATAEMQFDGVRVPADHLIGEEGRGFGYVMRGLDEGRLGVAAMSLGIAEGAFAAATRYAGERRQFGHEIISYQGMQFLIADMSIAVQAARSLTYDALKAFVDRDPKASSLAAIAKVFASDTAMSVSSDAVQVHGGAGYVRDFPVEMFMRDAKIGQIYEGTNQILRSVVARSHYPRWTDR